MKNTLRLTALLITLGLCLPAEAGKMQYRTCLDKDGHSYQTYEESCPDSMSEVKKKAVSCKMPDGSRGFGDACPKADQATGEIDQRELSARNQGITTIDRWGQRRMLIQGQIREAAAHARREAAEQQLQWEQWQEYRLNAIREYQEDRRVVDDYNIYDDCDC